MLAAAAKSLKRFRQLVHDGNLREMKAALLAVEQTAQALQQQVTATAERWDFDETSYFASGAYSRELLEAAARMQVAVFEQDERLYCYPSLVRVLAAERSILINRTRERRLRALHARAFAWDPPDLRAGEQLSTTRIRQYVRRWINEWDLKRLYPDYAPDTVVAEFAGAIHRATGARSHRGAAEQAISVKSATTNRPAV